MSNKVLLAATVIIILALVATMIAFMAKSQKKGYQSEPLPVNQDPIVISEEKPQEDAISFEPPTNSLSAAQQKEYQAILAHNSEFTHNIRRIREVSPQDSGSGAMAIVNATCRGNLAGQRYSSTTCVTQTKDPVLGYRYKDGDMSGPLGVGAGALGRPF